MKKQIVYISSIAWDYAWHRQQEMMSKMAGQGFEILFVQPCSKRPFKRELIKQTDKIWTLVPSGLPYERVLRLVHWWNARTARRQMKKAMQKIGFENPIIWIDRVHGFDFKYFSKGAYMVYDLVDEILAFGRFRNSKLLIGLENRVLKNVNLLLSSSQTLLDRKIRQCGGRTKKSMFLPNGVDTSRFETQTMMEALRVIPQPRIGFVGTLSFRSLNVDLINEVARNNPSWNFIFVGPMETGIEKVLAEENIYLFERVCGEQIPGVINGFDVGIIPYNVDNEMMDYVFPRKACEFLAAGKPVVSTFLSEIKNFDAFVHIATTPKEFNEKLKKALDETGQSEARKEFVRRFDWDVLLEALLREFS